MKKYIITIDEGTTSERVSLYDTSLNRLVYSHGLPIGTKYPQIGYVEQSADEIWKKVKTSITQTIADNNLTSDNVLGFAITNQREAVVSFNKKTGVTLAPIISWQCKRTAEFCKNIEPKQKEFIQKTTGLIIDSYFSASKMMWLIKNNENVKKTNPSELALCTLDSFLIYKLTNGNSYFTDTTNASRTMLSSLSEPYQWNNKLLKFFELKSEYLPTILNSADNYGTAEIGGITAPILSVVGDQQSSLVGQGCIQKGMAKMTYGTGGFLLINTGTTFLQSNKRLLNTVAYSINNKVYYATEGSIFNVGSALNYAKNNLSLFTEYKDIDKICNKTQKQDELCFLPTFTGIGAPYWEPDLQAEILGITLDTTKAQILKALMQSFAFSFQEILSYLKQLELNIKEIKLDGGVSKNDYLLQCLADISKLKTYRTKEAESTTMGATYLALIYLKMLKLSDLPEIVKSSKIFEPNKENYKQIKSAYNAWHTELLNSINNKN